MKPRHKRFALLSLAALGVAQTIWPCDVLHCHDWQAALLPLLLKTVYARQPVFQAARSVLTIHNIAYQGVYSAESYGYLGLQAANFTTEKLEDHGRINFLKGGIVFSDAANTVSPTYAREIATAEFAFGLEGRDDAQRARGIG